ncbi:hypothetical protein K431DRAFT_44524 [Polychaeton citri CBS 116435]|uniref:Uncharacterized protein n=1 Tax=Polychaeton citri CBS 116435 TaxID=1314669 RepID=A0A9P4QCU0_9PEZI|nr:hypothetical protein K431DRAFT_44524 [Polychaeton citri CBS 116435]
MRATSTGLHPSIHLSIRTYIHTCILYPLPARPSPPPPPPPPLLPLLPLLLHLCCFSRVSRAVIAVCLLAKRRQRVLYLPFTRSEARPAALCHSRKKTRLHFPFNTSPRDPLTPLPDSSVHTCLIPATVDAGSQQQAQPLLALLAYEP